MSVPREVAVTSGENDNIWNACVWDPFTGTKLMLYRGGISAARTLNFVGADYLISAQTSKPLLQAWALQRRDQLQVRTVCPGLIGAMTVSPNGLHCASAINDKIHIWEVLSGNLIAVVARHYQTIRNLKFTDDGCYLLSGADDCLVLVWSFAKLLAQDGKSRSATQEDIAPMFTWSHHSLPVTDIYVGKRGSFARVLTSSLDNTCKMYDLSSGALLVSIVCNVGLHSVVMDASEFHIYLGAADGKIFPVNLFQMPRNDIYHLNDAENVSSFNGHTKPVTCLAVSLDGQTLLSGSMDNNAKVWDTVSGQCVRTFQHRGPVTNALLVPRFETIFSSEIIKPSFQLHPFKRFFDDEDNENGSTVTVKVDVNPKKKSARLPRDQTVDFPCYENPDSTVQVLELTNKIGKIQQKYDKLLASVLNQASCTNGTSS